MEKGRHRWTTPAEVLEKVRRRWDSGALLTAYAEGAGWQPFSITLHGPTVSEIGDRFDEVRGWVDALEAGSRRRGRSTYRIEQKAVGGRLLGNNRLPARVWLDGYDQAWHLLDVADQVAAFDLLLIAGTAAGPQIGAWMATHPRQTLRLEKDWPALLAVVSWITAHTGSAAYLRQIDVPGVDTKFIERHRGVLAQLLDRVLSSDRIAAAQPTAAFALRYGFLDKPAYVRFRLLSPSPRFPPGVSELTLRAEELATIDPGLRRVLVVENEITYLALPPTEDTMVLFGSGYSVATLSALPWLHDKRVDYWGDVDTHGFAILNRMRHAFPDARSLLMDRPTLLDHRDQWVTETKPTNVHLDRLSHDEGELYRDLVEGTFGPSIRLEQERVSYRAVLAALGDCGRQD